MAAGRHGDCGYRRPAGGRGRARGLAGGPDAEFAESAGRQPSRQTPLGPVFAGPGQTPARAGASFVRVSLESFQPCSKTESSKRACFKDMVRADRL